MPLAKGKIAPFTGTLVTNERLLRVGQKAERCDFLLKQNADTAEKHRENDLQLLGKMHELDEQRWQLRDETMQRRLERDFWTRPIIIVPLTFVATWVIFRTAQDLP